MPLNQLDINNGETEDIYVIGVYLLWSSQKMTCQCRAVPFIEQYDLKMSAQLEKKKIKGYNNT